MSDASAGILTAQRLADASQFDQAVTELAFWTSLTPIEAARLILVRRLVQVEWLGESLPIQSEP